MENCLFIDDFPIKNGDFPIKNCDFPIKNCDFPIKNGDFPIKNGDFPIKNCDFTIKNGDFPINTSIYKRFSMAMLVITRWYLVWMDQLMQQLVTMKVSRNHCQYSMGISGS